MLVDRHPATVKNSRNGWLRKPPAKSGEHFTMLHDDKNRCLTIHDVAMDMETLEPVNVPVPEVISTSQLRQQQSVISTDTVFTQRK